MISEPDHKILLFSTYSQKPPSNAYVNVSNGAKSRIDLSHSRHPYFEYARSKGSGETGRMHRLV